jgi:cytochrome b561
MAERHEPDRYSPAAVALHWIMLLLLAAVYATIELREYFPRGSDPREALKAWHFMLGLSVLALVWVRLAVRWRGGPPAREGDDPAWPRGLAAAVHASLYLFMILMPVAGWILLSAEGAPIPYLGLDLPPLVGRNEILAGRVEALHETVGTAGYFVIGAHAAAALFHHYFLKDRTLARMLPFRP